jgi:MFS family permease
MVVPLYISEISPPEIRGSLLVFEELSIVIGIVVAFWITYGTKDMTSHWSWQLPFLLQILPGLLLGFGAIFLPYSPRWLASKDREDEALDSLAKLRALPKTDPRVQREWMDIIAEARFQAGILRERHPRLTQRTDYASKIRLELVSWADCLKPGCWRRTLVGAGIMFFQQFSGINALIYYSPTLFGTMGLDSEMQLIMSGVLNVTQLVGVFSSLWTLDRFGRRTILLTGSFLMFVPHLIIAVLVGKFSHDCLVGTRPLGHASRGLPIKSTCQGCGHFDMFKLDQQLHYRSHHTPARSKDWLWGLCFLRCVLPIVSGLGLVLCAGDQW